MIVNYDAKATVTASDGTPAVIENSLSTVGFLNTAVPEPTSIAGVCGAAALMLRRRCRTTRGRGG